MNKDRLIKHKSMIHSKTYTEEELYVDDIDQPEDDMKRNICEKQFPRLAISWDLIPMLMRKINKIENTLILHITPELQSLSGWSEEVTLSYHIQLT